MASDFGIRISPRVQDSPLWTLSPRALRLWLWLAMKSQHATQRYTMADHQKVAVNRGQWLTSRRKLETDVGCYRSAKQVIDDLRELVSVGVISVAPVMRQRFQIDTASGSKSIPGGRCQNGTAGKTLATLITVHGINHLVEVSGSKLTPKERESVLRSLSREEQEWRRAEAQLVAEGR
jgi:hypothetical protein